MAAGYHYGVKLRITDAGRRHRGGVEQIGPGTWRAEGMVRIGGRDEEQEGRLGLRE